MPLEIEEKELDGGMVLIIPEGQVDAHSADLLDLAIRRSLEARRLKILLDLSKVTYISSAGIGVLIASLNEVIDERGGSLVLLTPAENVMDVLENMGFTVMFKIASSLKEAIAEAERQAGE